MKNSETITAIDIVAFILNDLLGWFIIICYDLTGNDSKFMNLKLQGAIFRYAGGKKCIYRFSVVHALRRCEKIHGRI